MSTPVTIDQLNMPGENWREFRKGYTRDDVSDNPKQTTIAKDQILGTKIPVDSIFPLDSTKNLSLLEVVDGSLELAGMHLEGVDSGTMSMMTVTGFSTIPAISPSTASLVITGNNTTVYSAQNSISPVTAYATWNFTDINDYDGRRVDFVFIRASVEVRTPYFASIPSDANSVDTMNFGGGLYINLFNTDAWMPIYSGGYLSGRTFILPVNPYHQISVRFMARGCYNWSVQILGIITGA